MVWNEQLKREIPEGWEVKKIDEISEVKAGGDKPKLFSENNWIILEKQYLSFFKLDNYKVKYRTGHYEIFKK